MSETQLAVVSATSESVEEIAPEIARILKVEDHPAWPTVSQLPVLLAVNIRLNRMRIRDLLMLDKGQVLESCWSQARDVPIVVGESLLCWGEFEVSGQRIGVRVTQLL